ncbi:hypothetical protein, partial [Streptomyces sp. NPDC003710]
MRVTRTMFASAAVAAAVALSAPAAHALSLAGPRVADRGTSYGIDKQDPRGDSRFDNQQQGRFGQTPSGGVQAGGGALVLTKDHHGGQSHGEQGGGAQGGAHGQWSQGGGAQGGAHGQWSHGGGAQGEDAQGEEEQGGAGAWGGHSGSAQGGAAGQTPTGGVQAGGG